MNTKKKKKHSFLALHIFYNLLAIGDTKSLVPEVTSDLTENSLQPKIPDL